MVSIIVSLDTECFDHGDARTRDQEKENKIDNGKTDIVNKLLIHGDADKSYLGVTGGTHLVWRRYIHVAMPVNHDHQ